MSDAKKFIEESCAFLISEYFPKIERCLEKLTEEQIWWRPNEESNSIGNLLLHLSGNVRQWIVVGLGGAVDTRDRDTEFAQRDVIPRDELLSRLRETLREAERTLAAFDKHKWLDRFTIQGRDVSALAAVLRVVAHFAMHTGQIIMLAKMLSKERIRLSD